MGVSSINSIKNPFLKYWSKKNQQEVVIHPADFLCKTHLQIKNE
jgi:hypothetical protein